MTEAKEKKERVTCFVTEIPEGNSLREEAELCFNLFSEWKALSSAADEARQKALNLARKCFFHTNSDDLVLPEIGAVKGVVVTRDSVNLADLKLALSAVIGADKVQEIWERFTTQKTYKEIRFHANKAKESGDEE